MTLNFAARLIVLVSEALRSHDFICDHLALSVVYHLLGFHAHHPIVLVIDPATLYHDPGAFDLEPRPPVLSLLSAPCLLHLRDLFHFFLAHFDRLPLPEGGGGL